jgi:hypothetical protein
MFQLDDNLLRELGLGDLPPAEKNKMLGHIYETLELRVGMKLAEQMSDAQLDEFEGFIDGDQAKARTFLDPRFSGWEQSEDFLKQKREAEAKGQPTTAVISEYAALKWLETNFPHYKQVVADELEKLKAEIKSQAPAILAATMSELGGSQPPADNSAATA